MSPILSWLLGCPGVLREEGVGSYKIIEYDGLFIIETQEKIN